MSWTPIPCPVCGRTGYREGRMCPKQNSAGVCISCCKACDCYRPAHPHPCAFYVKYPQINYDEEIIKLTNKINTLREKVRYCYKKNWTQSAYKLEKEIEGLLIDRRRMEAEKNERNNQNPGTGSNRYDNNVVLYGTGRNNNSSEDSGRTS